jgi:hypothetical protein
MPQKYDFDATGNRDYFNKTLLDYTGKSFNELKGRGWAKSFILMISTKIKRYGENASKQVKITSQKTE